MSRTGKYIETNYTLVVARGSGFGRKRERLLDGFEVNFWGDENVLEEDSSSGG